MKKRYFALGLVVVLLVLCGCDPQRVPEELVDAPEPVVEPVEPEELEELEEPEEPEEPVVYDPPFYICNPEPGHEEMSHIVAPDGSVLLSLSNGYPRPLIDQATGDYVGLVVYSSRDKEHIRRLDAYDPGGPGRCLLCPEGPGGSRGEPSGAGNRGSGRVLLAAEPT